VAFLERHGVDDDRSGAEGSTADFGRMQFPAELETADGRSTPNTRERQTAPRFSCAARRGTADAYVVLPVDGFTQLWSAAGGNRR